MPISRTDNIERTTHLMGAGAHTNNKRVVPFLIVSEERMFW